MDTNLVLRAASAGNLTGDSTLTDVDLQPMIDPLYLHILVPSVSTDDVLDVTADFEDASNNTLQRTELPQISAAGHYVLPLFCDHPSLTDLSVILDATATGTAAMSFGAVVVYISNSRRS
jgi:hypothetical protein